MQILLLGKTKSKLISWGIFLTQEHSFGESFSVRERTNNDLKKLERRTVYLLKVHGCTRAAATWIERNVDVKKNPTKDRIKRWCRTPDTNKISFYTVITNPDFPDFKTGCYGKAIEIFENLQNDPNTTALFLKEDGVVIDFYHKPRI
jgi:hypothetical protein